MFSLDYRALLQSPLVVRLAPRASAPGPTPDFDPGFGLTGVGNTAIQPIHCTEG